MSVKTHTTWFDTNLLMEVNQAIFACPLDKPVLFPPNNWWTVAVGFP